MDIVMMGDSNAGRTSIAKTIVQKIVSKQTMLLTQTSKMESYDFKIHKIDFKLYDFPSKYEFSEAAPNQQMILKNASALIYVINPQLESSKSLSNFVMIYEYIKSKNTNNCQFFIFINKKDLELVNKDLRQQLILKHKKQLASQGIDHKVVLQSFTSILDYSIYQSFSVVIQRILPCTPYICKMLNKMASLSKMETLFIFDMYTKLYIAHNDDQASREAYKYQLCSEMIDIYSDIYSLYHKKGQSTTSSADDISEDKCEIVMQFGQTQNKQLFKLQKINNSVSLCYSIRESNYDRPYLIQRNLRVLKKGILNFLNETTKFLN